jgi:putative membrane protein
MTSLKAVPGKLRAAVPGARLWFAPKRLDEEGSTPDYRFSLANERTFLAWLRTAMALVGGGFAVAQFLTDLHHTLGEDLPVSRFPALLALAVAVIAVVMVIAVAAGWAVD